MATVFTRIIDGEIPGKFIWADARCVAFLSIEPLRPGHVLVVPREEIDQWVDLPEDLATHLLQVARSIGLAQRDAFDPARIGLMVQGYEIPHAHVHVWPSASPADFNLSSADPNASQEEFEDAAARLRAALRSAGYEDRVPHT